MNRSWLTSLHPWYVLIGLVGCLSGCGTFYEHHVKTTEYSLYSDHSPGELRETSRLIQNVMRAYRGHFPLRAATIPRPHIIFNEDELTRLRVFTAEARQEGYYLPFLNLIHLSPLPDTEDAESSQRVVLHELAHHFVVSAFPETRTLYWLNEGLACVLEVSFFDPEGRLVLPLYHLSLHRHAQRALREMGEEGFLKELRALVEGSWFHFHREDAKTRHYAMSWALVYHLLPQFDGSLEDRIAKILAAAPERLESQYESLLERVREEPDLELDRLAQRPELTTWCIETWSKIPSPRADVLLGHLVPLLEDPDPRRRTVAVAALAKALNRPLRGLDPAKERTLSERLVGYLSNGTSAERVAVARNLRAEGRRPEYFAPLIHLLGNPIGTLRAAAAEALAQLSTNPTITRPRFWLDAPLAARTAEIESWRRWLRRGSDED